MSEHDRLPHIELKVALGARKCDRGVVAKNLDCDHGERLALSRIDLPGIMEEPGSLSGICISPMPLRGPEESRRMSLAIFMRLTATVFNAPCVSTMASWAARASNLFCAVTKGSPVSVAICLATFSE